MPPIVNPPLQVTDVRSFKTGNTGSVTSSGTAFGARSDGTVQLGAALSGLVVVDCSLGQAFEGTLTADVQISVQNCQPGQAAEVKLSQNGAGGHAITTWNGAGGENVTAINAGFLVMPTAASASAWFNLLGTTTGNVEVTGQSSSAGGGGVTSVTATLPLRSTGGATPVISDSPAIITWKPGGVGTVSPVYANLSDVLSALADVQMNAILIIDTSGSRIDIPTGTLIDGLGRLEIRGRGFDIDTIEFTGTAQFKNVRKWSGLQIQAFGETLSPLLYDIQMDVLVEQTLFVAATHPLFEFAGTTALVTMTWYAGAFWANGGTNSIIHVSNFADLEFAVFGEDEFHPATDWQGRITADNGTTVDILIDSCFDPAIVAHLPGVLGSLTVIQTNQSSGVGYTPAAPAQWSPPAPTTTKQALDRLTATVFALNGGPIP